MISQNEQEEHEIIQAISRTQREEVKSPPVESSDNEPKEINRVATLTDNVMVMIVKEFEYVETLTGLKNGFLFTDRKMGNAQDNITRDIVPPEYWEVWQAIATSPSKRCSNLRTFLKKMLASKNPPILNEAFRLYMECICNMIYIEQRFKGLPETTKMTEQQLIGLSKLFSKNLCKRIIRENEYCELLELDYAYVSLALLNREMPVRELAEFQDHLASNYTKWKEEFAHFIEVTHFCLALEYYDVQVNYLYEGYFKNTEFETERNQPRLRIKN